MIPSSTLALSTFTIAQRAARPPRVPPPGGMGQVTFVLLVIGAMIVVVVIAGIVMVRLRKKATSDLVSSDAMTLDDLRRLKASGELSDEEYQTLSRAITQRSVAAMDARRAASQPAQASLRAQASRPASGDNSRTAPPGVDLTGDPLPKTPPPE